MKNSNKPRKQLLSLPLKPKGILKGKLLDVARSILERSLRIPELNELYSKVCEGDSNKHFCERVLQALNVTIDISEKDLSRIPKTGPLVVVANHPFGAIEGALLATVLLSVRPDVKILTNYILGYVPDLKDLCFYVDPFGKKESIRSNALALREALNWVEQGGLLAVFPSGEVSHLDLKTGQVTDPAWIDTVSRVILKTKSPALPIYFEGTNGMLFQLMGLIHPRLRTVLLPREFLNKKNKIFKVVVGNPIPNAKLASFKDDRELTEYLRSRTYLLQNRLYKQAHKWFSGKHKAIVQEEVAKPLPHEQVLEELANIRSKALLLTSMGFEVYCARGSDIPTIMLEIARLREETFRIVGEGTGFSLDTDDFDNYYYHLFVWDPNKEAMVGAYRLGLADEILDTKGPSGLYVTTLFDFEPEFWEKVRYAIELGRSFVTSGYQKSYASLFLLWKGIGAFLVNNPKYRYLFGPVSINDRYHVFSRQLMVRFLQETNFVHDLAPLVRPRMPFKARKIRGWKTNPVSSLVKDIEELSQLVADFETAQSGVPVLLRQYLKMGGKLLGFNVDPKFSYALDGLMLMDLAKADEATLAKYLGKDGVRKFLSYHESTGARKALGSSSPA
ncbi:MAG: GNAT family N-acetyltransferase [Planctomycetota bacterium]